MINISKILQNLTFKLTQKCVLVFCSIVLIGCNKLLNEKPEVVVLPKKMRSGTPVMANAQDFPFVVWWEKMHDPILNQLIEIGLARNNQLQAAKANVQQAKAQLQEARYAWLPTLNAYANGFVGGGWDSDVTPQGPLASSRALSNIGNIHFKGYFSGFTPRYAVNIWQNIHNTKFYKASLAMQQANYKATKLSIISQICGSYFMLVGEKQQLQDQETYLSDLRKLKQLELKRYQDGASDLTTITNINQQIEGYEANIATLKDSISNVENAIQILLNQNPASLKHTSLHRLTLENIIPSKLPATVLKNRPDVLMALHNVTMGKANVGIAYSNFFPSISLTNLLGSAAIDLRRLLTLSTGLWVAQGAINLPAIDGVSWEKIKVAKSGYLAAIYNYLQTLRLALADVDNNLTTYKRTKEAYQHQMQALHAAQVSYTLAQSRYSTGARDYREILNTKLTVDTAQLNVTLAKMQQLDSIVGVYQSVAAGIGDDFKVFCGDSVRRIDAKNYK